MATLLLGFVESMFLSISLSFLLYIFSYWILNRNSPVINWPFLGMLPGIINNKGRIHEYAAEVLKRSGYTKLAKGPWFSNMDFVITCDPMNVHHILSKNFINYPKGDESRMIMEPLGDGILNVDGDLWRNQRKIIHTLISHNKFNSALKKACNKKLEEGLMPILEHVSELEIVVDMQDILQRFTFDNICQLVLGFDLNCLSIGLPQVEYATAFDDLEEAALYRHIVPVSFWRLQKWLDIGQEKKVSKALKIFDKFIYDCISQKRETLSRRGKTPLDKDDHFDLLTPFMVDEEAKRFEEVDGQQMTSALKKSNKFVRDVAFNLLAAGRDTVSVGLTWYLWLVATHPSIEDKLLKEIKTNLKTEKHSDKLVYNDIQELNRLVYLHATLCETLRLYPPFPINHKATLQQDILPSGHHVNKDTRLLISYYAMGRSEEIWGKDCYEFKPERWISEKGCIQHVPSYKFAVFNAGPRTCLGKSISFMQMKMVAVAIIWNYHIHVLEEHPISPSDSVILRMHHGLKVRVCKRNIS